jgi:hypothetical protein
MNVFHCDHCDHVVFFENTQCVNCGHTLAFLPDLARMGALEEAGSGVWTVASSGALENTYRLCANDAEQHVCNWAVAGSDTQPLCVSCRLNRVIPDLSVEGNRESWFRIETAKRRLVYTLSTLELPLVSKHDDPASGLAFDFLSDAHAPGQVLTGHAGGVITLNIAEANDAERERRREQLHEPYRTLLGHFRHESGHYYWDRLVSDTRRLTAFRELFGDEREDYAAALQRHYQNGPALSWSEHFVSAYAAVHPWEDWAETWAHYLHMTDTLETAVHCGLSMRPRRKNEPALARLPERAGTASAFFNRLIDSWFPLTYALNNLNRGLGLPDPYPFVLSQPAIEKLRFVHQTVSGAAKRSGFASSRRRAAPDGRAIAETVDTNARPPEQDADGRLANPVSGPDESALESSGTKLPSPV